LATATADSFASLRNDKQKGQTTATADSFASLRNDKQKDRQPQQQPGRPMQNGHVESFHLGKRCAFPTFPPHDDDWDHCEKKQPINPVA
jgi:hypothetical protein